MIIEPKREDIVGSTVVEPAWYEVEVTSVEDKMSKDNTSTNSWLKGKIVKNADNGDTKYAGVPTPFLWMINSKGIFASVALFKSIGVDMEDGKRYDTQAFSGRRLEAFIGNELYNGAMQNKMMGQYRMVKTS